MLTASQERFIALSRELEDINEARKAKCKELEAVAVDIGVGKYFQDKDTTVYKIVEPKGTFVDYKKIGYIRTRRNGEERGDLSLKEAKEAGFLVGEK